MSEHDITVTVNGQRRQARVEARTTLGDFLRGQLGYTGLHLACEHGVCGACTLIVDGKAVRSCLMFAVQVDGSDVRTVEGLAADDGTLSPVQQAMRECHALQCGFCTPGVVMTLTSLTEGNQTPDSETLVKAMSGHLCRCTGYQGIRKAIDKLTGETVAEAGEHA
jgi:carbon-monoxide dehydrogenase small subunit